MDSSIARVIIRPALPPPGSGLDPLCWASSHLWTAQHALRAQHEADLALEADLT